MAARLPRVLEHRHVLRATDDEGVNVTQRRRFVHAILGGFLLTRRIGHPNSPPARPAAEGIVSVARHLDEFAADQFEDAARLVIIAVEPTQVARVVERDALAQRLDHVEPALGNELYQHRRVVADGRNFGEFGVFVSNCVVAMRVRRDDTLELPRPLHLRDVVLDEARVETLLADAAHVVARCALAIVEDGKVEAGGAK